jgi:hypothetical protein
MRGSASGVKAKPSRSFCSIAAAMSRLMSPM